MGIAKDIDRITIQELEPTLLRYAKRAVKSDALAKDLVQDTWIAAMSTCASFEGRAALSSWLVSILRRKVLDHWRRTRPQDELDEDQLTADRPVVDQQLDEDQLLDRVRSALATLPPLERDAVHCCDVEDLDRDHAADRLGISRGHLRVVLHRGRHRIRQLVTADLQEH